MFKLGVILLFILTALPLHATLGNGRIVENGEETELVGVNRDINNTQVTTRDETRGGVDVHMNVDNTYFTGRTVQRVRRDEKTGLAVLDGNGDVIFDEVEQSGAGAFLDDMQSTPHNLRTVIGTPHYIREAFNDAPVSLDEARLNGGVEQSDEKSEFHRIGEGNEDNVKVVFEDGTEAVYNKQSKKLVKDPVNKGTRNWASNDIGHTLLDIAPWVVFGNNPNDYTNVGQRVDLTIDGANKLMEARQKNR